MNGAIVRWEIDARGEVQKVGYRAFVESEAVRLGLFGSVGNDARDPHLVRIVAQGGVPALRTFVEAISGEHGIIRADSVTKVAEGPADTSLTCFTQLRGDALNEIAESAEASVKLLGRAWDTGKETLAVGKETLAVGKETLAVSKETLGVSRETLGVGRETLGAVQEGNRSLGSRMDRGFTMLGSKVDRVAEAVARESRSNVSFRHELAGAVALLDSKYGAITRTLQRIDKDLQAQTRAVNRQSEAILKLASQVARSTSQAKPPRASKRPR